MISETFKTKNMIVIIPCIIAIALVVFILFSRKIMDAFVEVDKEGQNIYLANQLINKILSNEDVETNIFF